MKNHISVTRRQFVAGISALVASGGFRMPAYAGLTPMSDASLIGAICYILQPATSNQICEALKLFEGGARWEQSEIQQYLDQKVVAGELESDDFSNRSTFCFSQRGRESLPPDLRRFCDHARLILLNTSYRLTFGTPRGKLYPAAAGVAPASAELGHADLSLRKGCDQHGVAVIVSFLVSRDSIWPGQLPRGIPFKLSRPNIANESGIGLSKAASSADKAGVSRQLGISKSCLSELIANKHDYYRRFEIPKKNGGSRLIEAPRLPLKAIQRFIYFAHLGRLFAHDSVHSYRVERSFISNALVHERQRYVLRLDIENFFSSISSAMVDALLSKQGFNADECRFLSSICTLRRRLPQGAPTSPVLSNAILHDFDQTVSEECRGRDLRFTRYADDMTVSGADKNAVSNMKSIISSLLSSMYGLRLNEAKTVLLGSGQRKVVTGVVVNDACAPTRTWRKSVRSVFHKASLKPWDFVDRYHELSGMLNHLRSFPKFRASEITYRYQKILDRVAAERNMFA